MRHNDIFADEVAVEADLALHEHLVWSRATLAERLVEASASLDADLAETLRIETMYQFCEFFYLLRARRMESVEQISQLAQLHNDHLVMLTQDKAKMRRLGLREDRLLAAMFTVDTLPRLIEVWRQMPGHVDQSNLARFLVTVMSTETCHKLVVAATQAGFLTRTKSPYGTMLVASTGVMEQTFGGVMRELRTRIAELGNEGDEFA